MATTETPSISKDYNADQAELTNRDTTSSPMLRVAKVVEIVSGADVTLQAGRGAGALDIKVSGVVLGLASRVFHAELNSRFIEATTSVISLTEDDPEVILDFCYIIHHQCESLQPLDADRLRGLLTLADMRDCREALKPWMFYILKDYIHWVFEVGRNWANFCEEPVPFPSTISGLRIEYVVVFAFVFDVPKLFRDATTNYLAKSTHPFIPILPIAPILTRLPILGDSANIPSESTLPDLHIHDVGVFELLDNLREERIQGFRGKVLECINQDFAVVGNLNPHPVKARFCKASQTKYGAFMYWLTKGGILPVQSPDHTMSWMGCLRCVGKLAGTSDYDLHTPVATADTEEESAMEASGINNETACDNEDCQYCNRDIRRDLRLLLQDEYSDLKGVCLPHFKRTGELCMLNSCQEHT